MYWQGPPLAAPLLPELDIDPPPRQRRLTVFFRALILIPQVILLWFISLAAGVVAVIAWFGALFMGRLPAWAWLFLSQYVGYTTRVAAYGQLLVDRYPPFSFTAPGYPVQVDLPPPGPLNRLAVLFRYFLAIPALIVSGVLQVGWGVCGFFIWLIVLILGRMPDALFRATAAVERFHLRTSAYFFMLTPQYPARLFGDGELTAAAPGAEPGTVPTAGPWPEAEPGAEPTSVPNAGPPAGLGAQPPEGTWSGGLPSAPPLSETWTGSQWATAPMAGGAAAPRSATRPLLMTSAARVLLVLFIVLGAVGYIGDIVYNSSSHGTTSSDNGAARP